MTFKQHLIADVEDATLHRSIQFKMPTFSRLIKTILFFAAFALSSAHAATLQTFYSAAAGNPSIKLENYMGNSVVLWNTSSTCQGGVLILPASATSGDRNRLYATVIAAKTTAVTMFIYYDDQAGCTIVSFGLL